MLSIAAILGIISLGLVGIIWKGYVLTYLWAWFVVPAFGLPVLSLATAIGISLVVSFITHQYVYAEDNRSQGNRVAAAAGTMLLYPALALVIGWIIKGFM